MYKYWVGGKGAGICIYIPATIMRWDNLESILNFIKIGTWTLDSPASH
jgi:hypothetical protein